jgi:hypothetical protein
MRESCGNLGDAHAVANIHQAPGMQAAVASEAAQELCPLPYLQYECGSRGTKHCCVLQCWLLCAAVLCVAHLQQC